MALADAPSRTRHPLMQRVEALYDDPVRLVTAMAGWWWVSNLLIGLLISHDFSTSPVRGETVDLLVIPVAVNGWHLIVHGATGVIGLAAARRRSSAILYLGLFAPFYVAWGAAGLATDGTVVWSYADTFGSWVHVVEGMVLGMTLTFAALRAGRA